jgi:NitT/TauT family transport system permease protein
VGVAWATAFPILLSAALKGFEAARSSFGELAQILGASRSQAALYIYLPASTPFIVAASRSALGAALRISVVAEAFGSAGGIGYRLWVFYEIHRYEGFLAWSAALLILMVALDRLVLAPLESWSRRWMQA